MDDRTIADTAYDLHGAIDGYVVTFHGQVIARAAKLEGAVAALRLARLAVAECDDLLADLLTTHREA